jgi:serine/threonine protein kinase
MSSEPRVLADRYQLSRKLGAGPVGEVWEARDLVLGQPVAVKVVHDHLAAVEAFRARFRSLAREAARVQHPNVAAVHDVDEDGNFVVTELVAGPSARQLLAEQGTLPLETATRLAAGACSALSAAHATGVLHRGLKPENLLAIPDGGVKVTDFGVAGAGLDPVWPPSATWPLRSWPPARWTTAPTSTGSAAACTSCSAASHRSTDRRSSRSRPPT